MGIIGWTLVILALGAGLVLMVVRVFYRIEWTGFGTYVVKKTTTEEYNGKTGELVKTSNATEEQNRKTLWDWIGLFTVSAVLVALGLWYSAQQNERQEWIEDQRAQQAVQQSYLDQMGTLLLDRNLRLADENDVVRMLARARTLAALDALGPTRTRRVLRFLYETELIQGIPPNEQPIISLKYADLEGVDLSRRGLLSGADLERADITDANLRNADLSATNLTGAHLRGTDLTEANLTRTDLTGAYLVEVNLTDATGVTNDELERQASSLAGTTMPDGSRHD
jgi:uncharacterized protein YjbI with pentapeptide repeats